MNNDECLILPDEFSYNWKLYFLAIWYILILVGIVINVIYLVSLGQIDKQYLINRSAYPLFLYFSSINNDWI